MTDNLAKRIQEPYLLQLQQVFDAAKSLPVEARKPALLKLTEDIRRYIEPNLVRDQEGIHYEWFTLRDDVETALAALAYLEPEPVSTQTPPSRTWKALFSSAMDDPELAEYFTYGENFRKAVRASPLWGKSIQPSDSIRGRLIYDPGVLPHVKTLPLVRAYRKQIEDSRR